MLPICSFTDDKLRSFKLLVRMYQDEWIFVWNLLFFTRRGSFFAKPGIQDYTTMSRCREEFSELSSFILYFKFWVYNHTVNLFILKRIVWSVSTGMESILDSYFERSLGSSRVQWSSLNANFLLKVKRKMKFALYER